SPHGRLAQLGAAEAELAIVAARAARDLATIAQTDLARIAGQSLQLGLRRLALRRAGRRLANNLFQTSALRRITLHQLCTLLLAVDHRCLGHRLALRLSCRASFVSATCGTEN